MTAGLAEDMVVSGVGTDWPAGTDVAGLRVLVAEDNPVNQVVARLHLEALGVHCRVVGTGQDALDVLHEGWDLVLMDLQMPVLDGIEATRRLRADERAAGRCRLPVVALTASAEADDWDRCRAAGMDRVLAKPLSRPALLRVLARLRPVRRAA